MEFVAGGSLFDRVQALGTGLPVGEVVLVGQRVAGAAGLELGR
jgi:hypothetical protein